MNDEKDTKIKIDFFMSQKMKVHVSKKDGFFWNGYIIDEPAAGVYEFEEDKMGKVFLFLGDIYKIVKNQSGGKQ